MHVDTRDSSSTPINSADGASARLTAAGLARYLERLGHTGSTAATLETLAALHRAHLRSVPFENLDIVRGVPVVLDVAALFEKIVARGRGGFCYELNGLFALLLRTLGFRVTLLSARVAGSDGALGPEHDHLTLWVDVEGGVLADVGFGDGFTRPIALRDREVSEESAGTFRLVEEQGLWTLERLDAEGTFIRQYVFTMRPHTLEDFAAMCEYHQSSPASHFTTWRVCTRLTEEGRVTISDDRLVEHANGVRTVQPIEGPDELTAILASRFGIDLYCDLLMRRGRSPACISVEYSTRRSVIHRPEQIRWTWSPT